MNIIWLSVKDGTPARGYWDQRLLEEFFEKENNIVWHCPNFENESTSLIKEAIVVIPGAYQADCIDQINTLLARIEKLTVIITSDEENNFPIDELSHENMRVFANYYNSKYKSDIHWLPIGPAITQRLDAQAILPAIKNDFFFAGQVTHPARENYIREIRNRKGGIIVETQGFAQGISPYQYHYLMSVSKVAPCPAGNISPDSFRTYEAICAGAVPIPTNTEWHRRVFGEVPFPVIDDYEQINGYMNDAIAAYPSLNNRVQEWWIAEKRKLKNQLLPPQTTGITVIIPVSPIKSHPSIAIIDETIKSVRKHLKDAEIIVTFDGVRAEQEDRRDNYEQFKRNFLWKCLNDWEYKNIFVIDFQEHSHQVKMAREALKYASTDAILYVEQDTPLTPDVPIEWQKCLEFIRSGEANMIRFHFEAFIPGPHEHMMLGDVENGFLRTSQWSQRPHLISKAYFQRVLDTYFTEDAICFIEDKMHGIVSEAYIVNKLQGWYQHRIWIYHPEGNIKRSYHTDGRAGEAKWDDTQTW